MLFRSRANARAWTDVLAAGGPSDRRPDDSTWSTLEYACHVRDVHRVFATRVRAMQNTDDPLF